MNYYNLIVPHPHLMGIAVDMPISDASYVANSKPIKVATHGCKRDEHTSFPKGFPKVFGLRDERIKLR